MVIATDRGQKISRSARFVWATVLYCQSKSESAEAMPSKYACKVLISSASYSFEVRLPHLSRRQDVVYDLTSVVPCLEHRHRDRSVRGQAVGNDKSSRSASYDNCKALTRELPSSIVGLHEPIFAP